MPAAEAEVAVRANSVQPRWYNAYFLAMVESDRNLVLARIEQAQQAIQERVLELRDAPRADGREMQDLTSALIYLGILLMHIGSEGESLLWE